MIEQTGSIFMECEEGHFHPSIFSDVIVRDEITHKFFHMGKGLIQVISLLPKVILGLVYLLKILVQFLEKMIVRVEER